MWWTPIRSANSAGNLKHYALDEGDSQAIYDSDYTPVGAWRITPG